MQGKMVTLRSILKNDSDKYFKWINDKKLVLKNSDFCSISKKEHEDWFSNILMHHSNTYFSIVENTTNSLIGSCSLRNLNHHHRNAELQIRIGEYDYQNKGLGTEAVNLLVEYGFIKLNLMRIYLHVFCNNTRAIKTYEKCNFKTEGILRKAAYIDGKFIDLNLMSILND